MKISDGFTEGWRADATWKPAYAEKDETDEFVELAVPQWRKVSPRDGFCEVLAGLSVEDRAKRAAARLGEGLEGIGEEVSSTVEEVDWLEVGRHLGRGTRRTVRLLEFNPLHALCWMAIIGGSLRLNTAVFPSMAITVGIVVWGAHDNPLTEKLPHDAREACTKIEEAVGLARKHANKTIAPLAVTAIMVWVLPEAFAIPLTVVTGGFGGAVAGHVIGTPNEWEAPPDPETVESEHD